MTRKAEDMRRKTQEAREATGRAEAKIQAELKRLGFEVRKGWFLLPEETRR